MINPFSLTFGKAPKNIISRTLQQNEIIDCFKSDNPEYQVCMITGVRGAGKTVAMTSIAREIAEDEQWTVINLNPERNLLDTMAANIKSMQLISEYLKNPAVLENGREWMTLLPNETITTEPALRGAQGRVLTYGLGLGYFAVRAAMKPEVSSVTVVEKSPDAIALFRREIEPLFPEVAGKITVVEDDALDYAGRLSPGQYDVIFADIWHDAGDGRELYLRFKELEGRCPDADHFYWLEDTLRCYLDESLW